MAFAASLAQAQPAPVGPLLSVDGFRAMAMAPGGRLAVAYHDGNDFVRIAGAGGAWTGPAFPVTNGDGSPSVVRLAFEDGDTLLVVRIEHGAAAAARPYRLDGTPAGAWRRILRVAGDTLHDLAVCPGRASAAAWSTAHGAIFVQPLRSGAPFGPPVPVTDPRGTSELTLACGADGRFAVAWRFPTFPDYGGRFRLFDAAGAPVTAAVTLPVPRITETGPAIAMLADGRFAVAWQAQETGTLTVAFYDAGGRPLRAPRAVVHGRPRLVSELTLLAGGDGSYTVLWDDLETFSPTYGVSLYEQWRARFKVRRFTAGGEPLDAPRTLTQLWAFDKAAWASDGGGHLAMAWGGHSLLLFNATEPGRLALNEQRTVVDEQGGAAVLLVERTGGSAGEVAVDYETVAGTAAAGSDFEATRGTVVFPDQVSEPRRVRIPLRDDGEAEGVETFTVVLGNPAGGAALGRIARTVVEIRDDDRRRLALTGPPVVVSTTASAGAAYGQVRPPAVAVSEAGGFAITWNDYEVAFAQVFDAAGRPRGEPWSHPRQGNGALAALSDGWGLVRHFDAGGQTETWLAHGLRDGRWLSPILLHQGDFDNRHDPAVGSIALAPADGRRLALLGSLRGFSDTMDYCRFTSGGRTFGRGAVIEPRDSLTRRVDLAVAAGGTALAVWGPAVTVAAIRPDGRLARAPAQVSSAPLDQTEHPAVAALDGGRFLVVWYRFGPADTRPARIEGRLFGNDGSPLGAIFQVSSDPRRHQVRPVIAALGDHALVVWESLPAGDGPRTLRARLIDGRGRAVGAELTVAGAGAGIFGGVDVAANRGGRAVIVATLLDGIEPATLVAQRASLVSGGNAGAGL